MEDDIDEAGAAVLQNRKNIFRQKTKSPAPDWACARSLFKASGIMLPGSPLYFLRHG
jgi:hypothetical protein